MKSINFCVQVLALLCCVREMHPIFFVSRSLDKILRKSRFEIQKQEYEVSKTYVAITQHYIGFFNDVGPALRRINISVVIFNDTHDQYSHVAGRYRAYAVAISMHGQIEVSTDYPTFDPMRLNLHCLSPSLLSKGLSIPYILFKFIKGNKKASLITDFYGERFEGYLMLFIKFVIESKPFSYNIQLSSIYESDMPHKNIDTSDLLTCFSPYELSDPSLQNAMDMFTPGVWSLIFLFITIILLIIHLRIKLSINHLLHSVLEHLLNADTFAAIPSGKQWSVVICKITFLLLIDIFFFTIFKNDFISVLTTPTKISVLQGSARVKIAFKTDPNVLIASAMKRIDIILSNNVVCTDIPGLLKKITKFELLREDGTMVDRRYYTEGSTIELYHFQKPIHESGLFDAAMKTRLTHDRRKRTTTQIHRFGDKIAAKNAYYFQKVKRFIEKNGTGKEYDSKFIYDTLKLCLKAQVVAALCCTIEVLWGKISISVCGEKIRLWSREAILLDRMVK